MLKNLKYVSKVSKKGGLFLGGVAFGTAGLKLLTSKEAKKVYAQLLSKGFKIKDEVNATISIVKQHSDDIYEEAKDIYNEQVKEENVAQLNKIDNPTSKDANEVEV